MRSLGRFRYSPTLRPGVTTRRDGGSTEWWLVIDADPELGRLLRHLYFLGCHRVSKANPPLWGAHISVIRGEEPPEKAAWKRYDGQPIEFDYDPTVRETEGYLWVPVTCDIALSHRLELGLPREPVPAMHLTIGNLKHEREVEGVPPEQEFPPQEDSR